VDGIAKVDGDKCIACGKCVTLCPKNLIEMVPYDKRVRVACDAHESGKNVRVNCKAGCITCRLCEKECKFGAINVYHELAEVDYDKCTQCMACVGKCPPKSIVVS
jgi:ferredoxin